MSQQLLLRFFLLPSHPYFFIPRPPANGIVTLQWFVAFTGPAR